VGERSLNLAPQRFACDSFASTKALPERARQRADDDSSIAKTVIRARSPLRGVRTINRTLLTDYVHSGTRRLGQTAIDVAGM